MIRQLALGRLSVALLEQLVHGEAARAQGGEEHEAAAHLGTRGVRRLGLGLGLGLG